MCSSLPLPLSNDPERFDAEAECTFVSSLSASVSDDELEDWKMSNVALCRGRGVEEAAGVGSFAGLKLLGKRNPPSTLIATGVDDALFDRGGELIL